MAFIRSLTAARIEKMQSGDNERQFKLLKDDVLAGEVFPAIRANELHFYYKGGRLYKFNGTYSRDGNYKFYSEGTEGLSDYGKAKKENENKFTNKKGGITERRLLDKLYCHTYGTNLKSRVVVLDIEVSLKGKTGGGKKCDLVLLNTQTDELMFVEGKVYSDTRVRCKVGYLPEVIGQVDIYTAAIREQRQNILAQYVEYIRIINGLFGTSYRAPQKLIEPAKLLVYGTGGGRPQNIGYTIQTINQKLGAGNVMWVREGEPTTDEIWNALCGGVCR